MQPIKATMSATTNQTRGDFLNGTRSLAELAPGMSGQVLRLDVDCPELRNRLHVFGVVPGVQLTVLARAPLGDPISVRLLDFVLSLRVSEARGVCVSLSL